MTTERKIAPDLVRVLAASAVVVMHIAALIYYELDTIGYRWWLTSNIINWGLKWSTPLFVMISGYFLLRSDTALNSRTFFRRRFSKILIPYLFWSLAYYLLNHQGAFTYYDLLEFFDKLWRSSTNYHLYFINVILGLYLATPFIKKHILDLNLNLIVPSLLLFSTIYLVGTAFFGLPQPSNIFTWFVSYLGFYIAGYWLGKLKAPQYPPFYILLFLSSLLISILITRKTYFIFENQEKQTILVKHFSPTIIIATLSLFYFMINIANRALGSISGLAKLSKLSLGVYFIHPLFITLIGKIGLISSLYLPNYGLWLFSMIVLCVSTSFLSVSIIKKIPYLSATV